MVRIGIALVLGFSACVLVGCGSGSEPPVPDDLVLDVSVRANRIDIDWDSVIAGEYILYRDIDGVAGNGVFEPYQELPSNAVNFTIPASVHLFDWESEPQFYLEGCNLNGCGTSNIFTIEEGYNKAATGYFKASNATVGKADNFGSALAIDLLGLNLIVGAPLEDSSSIGTVLGDGTLADNTIDDRLADSYENAPDSGAVYAYTLNDFGQWVQLNYIKAPDITTSEPLDPNGDLFGYAVAISGSGNVMAIGAPAEDGGEVCSQEDGEDEVCAPDLTDNSAPNSGAVFIYKFSSDPNNFGWYAATYLKPDTIEQGAGFGSALALNFDGTILVVGAPDDSTGGSLSDNNGVFSVIDGVIVDEQGADVESSGSVYVIAQSSENVWETRNYIKAPNVQPSARFGSVVNLSNDGEAIAIGVPNEGGGDAGVLTASDAANYSFLGSDVGAVHVYELQLDDENNVDWFYDAYLKPPVVAENMRFGTAIDFSAFGEDIVVGAPGDGEYTGGSAYIYSRDTPTSWDNEITILTAGDDADFSLADGQTANSDVSDGFGSSVAMVSLAAFAGEDAINLNYFGMVVVGAPGEDGNGEGVISLPNDGALDSAGAAYMFLQDEDLNWTRERYIKAPNSMPAYEFGSNLALTETGATIAVGSPGEGSSKGGIGLDPDGLGLSAEDQNDTAAPGAGAVYLY